MISLPLPLKKKFTHSVSLSASRPHRKGSKLLRLTTFNALTSKKLESSAHGSCYQVVLTTVLLPAKPPHDFWLSTTSYYINLFFTFARHHHFLRRDAHQPEAGVTFAPCISQISTILRGKKSKLLKPRFQILLGHKAKSFNYTTEGERRVGTKI